MLLNYSHSYKLRPILHFSPPKTSNVFYYKSNLQFLSYFERRIRVMTRCQARRRARFEDEEEEEDGYNEEIGMLELYSQTARGEALLVTALVDGLKVEILIFKGYSSCLSNKTSPDLSKSVLPQRAVIKSIDRIKGPFNPANIDYIEQGLPWETFRSRISRD